MLHLDLVDNISRCAAVVAELAHDARNVVSLSLSDTSWRCRRQISSPLSHVLSGAIASTGGRPSAGHRTEPPSEREHARDLQ